MFSESRVFQIKRVFSCASLMISQDIVPIIPVSCVTGLNLNLLESFLNVLPTSGLSKSKQEELSLVAPLFCVDEVFTVPHVRLFAIFL